MPRRYEAGRRHTPHLFARHRALPVGESQLGSKTAVGGEQLLCSPNVGEIIALAQPGALLSPGDAFAKLSELGFVHELRVPPGAFGQVTVSLLQHEGRGSIAVQYDQPLLVLDPNLNADASLSQAAGTSTSTQGGLVFPSPSSGRFYQRPSPDRPPFIEVGQVIKRGQTVGLLEIMKTFTRIQFDADSLPESVKVVELLAKDDDEVSSGDPIFRFEEA